MPERESKTSTVPNVWATFGIFSLGAIQIISCRAWLVIMDETWLYNYDPEAKQQSIKWRQSGSHHPKKSRVQKSAGNVLASIFWIKTASSSLIIFQRDKLSTRSITHLCWWKKSAAGRSPSWSCSCTTMPRLTGHLQPTRNWPTSASSVLITHPILRIWPRRTTTCSLYWKTIERLPFFVRRNGHCCRGDLVGRTTFWFFFFEWLAKVTATG